MGIWTFAIVTRPAGKTVLLGHGFSTCCFDQQLFRMGPVSSGRARSMNWVRTSRKMKLSLLLGSAGWCYQDLEIDLQGKPAWQRGREVGGCIVIVCKECRSKVEGALNSLGIWLRFWKKNMGTAIVSDGATLNSTMEWVGRELGTWCICIRHPCLRSTWVCLKRGLSKQAGFIDFAFYIQLPKSS